MVRLKVKCLRLWSGLSAGGGKQGIMGIVNQKSPVSCPSVTRGQLHAYTSQNGHLDEPLYIIVSNVEQLWL